MLGASGTPACQMTGSLSVRVTFLNIKDSGLRECAGGASASLSAHARARAAQGGLLSR